MSRSSTTCRSFLLLGLLVLRRQCVLDLDSFISSHSRLLLVYGLTLLKKLGFLFLTSAGSLLTGVLVVLVAGVLVIEAAVLVLAGVCGPVASVLVATTGAVAAAGAVVAGVVVLVAAAVAVGAPVVAGAASASSFAALALTAGESAMGFVPALSALTVPLADRSFEGSLTATGVIAGIGTEV